MTVCLRPACSTQLPAEAHYCHACGAPQLWPCPVCGHGGATGLGLSLSSRQCPQCRSFLSHCPNCSKPFPLSADRCDNEAWSCAGTRLVSAAQAFVCVGANPQRSRGLVDDRSRTPLEGSGQLTRAWRLELPHQRALSDAVVAYGRVFAVQLRSRRLISLPLWFDRQVASRGERFGFDEAHDLVDRSDELPILATPTIRDLTVRGGHVSFLVRPKPVVLHDGRTEQSPEAVAFLVEASTLRVVRQVRRDRVQATHLGPDRWLLLRQDDGVEGSERVEFQLLSASDDVEVATDRFPGRLLHEVPVVEIDGRAYVATSTGVVEIDLRSGGHRALGTTTPLRDVRGLIALGPTLYVLTAGQRVGEHGLLAVEPGGGHLVDVASLNVPVDGPLVALDETLYLLDDNAKTLRAYSAASTTVFPSPDQNVRLRELGETRDLMLVRSGHALFLARKIQAQQDFTSFQLDQVMPGDRGTLGYHRVRSPETSFAYAEGRLLVIDRYEGTIEALEVFQP